MFRLYDWRCIVCGTEQERVVEFAAGDGAPDRIKINCDTCAGMQWHRRCAVNLTAPYAGERTHNPLVSGGRYDTMGNAPLPKLPEPQSVDSWDGMRAHLTSPEFTDAFRRRAEVRKQNAAKKKRLAALRRGENVNIRRDRMAGDPKPE